MTILAIYHDNAELIEATQDFEAIANRLHSIGVLFERWHADRILDDGATQDEIIAAYHGSVDRLMQHYNFKSADVISMTPDHPDREVLRNKFLDEHTHSDFEVRFFVDGQGLFFIHADDRVHAILCTQGDLISVPANTPHWFDMGTEPHLKCIRLFTTPEGWVANYTGSAIAKRFPKLDDFAPSRG
jgi:1,2-dihydroxy-3-keto-5-methylthiopentene dioxygenase